MMSREGWTFKKQDLNQNPNYVLNRFFLLHFFVEVLSLFLLVGGIASKFPNLVK